MHGNIPAVSISGAPTIEFRFAGDTCTAGLAGARLYVETRGDGGADMRITDATGFVLANIVVNERTERNLTENVVDIGSALLWSHWRHQHASKDGSTRSASELRERAIEIARACAKAKPQSYYAEPFEPHEWVVDAILEAMGANQPTMFVRPLEPEVVIDQVLQDIEEKAIRAKSGKLRVSARDFQHFANATQAKVEFDEQGVEFITLHVAHGTVRLEPIVPFVPSEVVLSVPPLVDTMQSAECEFAAALIVRACHALGDAWKPIAIDELVQVIKTDEEHAREPFASLVRNPFFRPDFRKLAERGFARWLGEPGESALELTEAGIAAIAKHVPRSGNANAVPPEGVPPR